MDYSIYNVNLNSLLSNQIKDMKKSDPQCLQFCGRWQLVCLLRYICKCNCFSWSDLTKLIKMLTIALYQPAPHPPTRDTPQTRASRLENDFINFDIFS